MSTIAAGTTSTTALVSTGDTTGKLTFQTNGTTTAMTIDTSQNVGIGVTPTVRFQVRTGTDQQLWVRPGTDLGGANGIGIQSANDAGSASKDLTLYGTAISLLGGNVGIGTSAPPNKLTVWGAGTLPSTVANCQMVVGNSDGFANAALALVTGSSNSASVYFGSNTSPTKGQIEYDNSSNYLRFLTNSAERMRITSDGNLAVGTTGYSNVRLNVVGQNTSSANWTVYAENSSNALLLGVRNDGAITTGSTTLSPYNNTTGLSANVLVGSDGFLYRSTSSLRYKSNVQDATHGLADVLKLRSVTYNAKNSGDALIGGLIAEEVDAAGLKEFVAYDKDGQPDALHYGNMVALLTKAIQELKAEVDALKAQLAKV